MSEKKIGRPLKPRPKGRPVEHDHCEAPGHSHRGHYAKGKISGIPLCYQCYRIEWREVQKQKKLAEKSLQKKNKE